MQSLGIWPSLQYLNEYAIDFVIPWFDTGDVARPCPLIIRKLVGKEKDDETGLCFYTSR